MQTYGRHLLMEYQGCDREILNNPEQLKEWMFRAAQASGATVVADVFHSFSPCGPSGVLVLQESHLSIHTWPENGYAAMDFYTCGDCDPFEGHLVLCQGLKPAHFVLMDGSRGAIGAPYRLAIADSTINASSFGA